jgi:hypothetical protein
MLRLGPDFYFFVQIFHHLVTLATDSYPQLSFVEKVSTHISATVFAPVGEWWSDSASSSVCEPVTDYQNPISALSASCTAKNPLDIRHLPRHPTIHPLGFIFLNTATKLPL